ncbi:MAG: TonB-dependent receptor [Marinobacter sp.]|nr:TonB-dependent receptor [Marinobacter sp.]
MRFEAGNDNWRLRVGVQERGDIGTGVGIAQALDPEGRYGSRRFNTDYSYRWRELVTHLDLEARVSYLYMTQEPKRDIVLFPPGAFGGAFPDGFIGSPGYSEQQARADISTLYRGFDSHLVRTGIGGLWGDLYKVTERKNFNPDGSPKGGVEDVSNRPDEVWMREKDRTSLYAFVQDEWQFAQNWQLVTGLRYDYYSDFGETINPRAALIWATTDDITTKLLYGRAFRAPSLLELYVVNNPVNTGNDQLKPETIHTVELAMTHQLERNLLYSVNLFYYEISNFITAVAVPGQALGEYRNVGERTGFGGEFEVAYSPNGNLNLVANYAYQQAEDDNTGKAVGEAPNHQVYGRAEWQFMPGWHLNTQVNWVGKQKRIAEDDRNPVSDYTTVDLTLRKLSLWRSLDASLTVRNLFDEDVRSPSPYGTPAPAIPNDFPMAGRSLMGELQYAF